MEILPLSVTYFSLRFKENLFFFYLLYALSSIRIRYYLRSVGLAYKLMEFMHAIKPKDMTLLLFTLRNNFLLQEKYKWITLYLFNSLNDSVKLRLGSCPGVILSTET